MLHNDHDLKLKNYYENWCGKVTYFNLQYII